MKSFITLLFAIIMTFSINAQEVIVNNLNKGSDIVTKLDTVFPQPYYKNGKIIGILFTIEQARKIDNDYELFYLMDSILSEYGINDSITIGIINSQGEKIKNLETQIGNCDKLLNNRMKVINELNSKINLYDEEIKIMKKKEESYIEETKVLKKEVKRQKRQKIFGYIVSGGIIILIILI